MLGAGRRLNSQPPRAAICTCSAGRLCGLVGNGHGIKRFYIGNERPEVSGGILTLAHAADEIDLLYAAFAQPLRQHLAALRIMAAVEPQLHTPGEYPGIPLRQPLQPRRPHG